MHICLVNFGGVTVICGKKLIALCTSRLHDGENCRCITELNRLFSENGCTLFIYDITADIYWNEDDIRAEAAVFDLIDHSHTDVIVIMDEKIKSHKVTSRIMNSARNFSVPVVVVDGNYEDCFSVSFDYASGFEKIVRHVIEDHGAKKLRLMAGIPGNPFSDEREEIFKKVAAENGITVTQDMISYGMFWAKPTINCTNKFIADGDIPDAVICANDIMAMNVSNILQEHGYSVPGDVIVTGFDGIDEIYYSSPQITSARCSTRQLAAKINEAVQDALKSPNEKHSYVVEPSVIYNGSCGCCDGIKPVDTTKLKNFNDRFYNYQDDFRVLSDVTDRMQAADNIAEASFPLFREVIHDMCCIIDPVCIDNKTNFFEMKNKPTMKEDMFMFFDTDSHPFTQFDFRRSDVIPDLEKHIADGFPLIFNVIDYLNMPIGYTCFHFKACEISDYCMIPQIVSAIGRGIGGFMNMQYQRYLIARIESMYKYDSLTGLYNRISFSRDYDIIIKQFGGTDTSLIVVLADLDGLKHINDSWGHSAGDNAIKTVASALKNSCPDNALCVRFGGDEMMAVIPGKCDVKAIKNKIKDYLSRYNDTVKLPYTISASVGIYITDFSGDTDFETLVKRSDEAMYVEKQAKKILRK